MFHSLIIIMIIIIIIINNDHVLTFLEGKIQDEKLDLNLVSSLVSIV